MKRGVLSLRLSPSRSLSLSLPPSLQTAREKEGEAHADSLREPQRVELGVRACMCVRVFLTVWLQRARIIIVARKSFLWLREGGREDLQAG